MPILTDYPIVRPDLDRFYEIDRLVRGHAFAIHNRFGRLLNETAYRKELARRCRCSGLTVDEEFRVRFQHGSFSKVYRVDLELYREALFYLAGGAVNICRSVELRHAEEPIGRHDVALLSEDFALYVTSFTSDIDGMRDHLHRLLALTPLRGLAWINFNHLTISFETLVNQT